MAAAFAKKKSKIVWHKEEDVKLKNLLGENCLPQFEEMEVVDIKREAEKVGKGDVFFCLTANRQKAEDACKLANDRGARLCFSNFDVEGCCQLKDVRKVFSLACKNFYGAACDKMKMVAVCGTNGKTSTSHIVAQMFKRNGVKVGVVGTSGVFFDGKEFQSPLTTPDADFLHKTFALMQESGVEIVVMEVSAHAVDQKRVEGIKFDVAVLTNITQDHLDYFQTMEEYEKTKLSFFKKENVKTVIVCVDDERAKKLLQVSQVPILTYGIKNPSDAFAIDINCQLGGNKFVANVCDHIVEVKNGLVGEYNVYNTLAALSVGFALGLDERQLANGINGIRPIEGRFNVMNVAGKYVVIDYAHSPDGILNVVSAARKLAKQKVFIVFGCGGNRDKTKRPQMGKIASQLADMVCLTDDNPRLEKSMDIIRDIEEGIDCPHFVEPDREKAITKMLDYAKEGDIVIVSGKGAEKYQEVGTEKRPYSDFEAVYRYFQSTKSPQAEKRQGYEC